MIVNPVAGIFGNVAHKKVNATAISPGAVQAGFKGVAAFMGDVGHIQPLHNVPPKEPVCSHGNRVPLVANQPGATFSKAGFHKRPDLGVDRNHPVFPRLGFGAALHGSGFQVNIFRGECQQFRDTPPTVYENQHRVNPRFPGVLP